MSKPNWPGRASILLRVQGVYVQKTAGFDQEQVTRLVKEGKHIEAIKLIREQSGLGLKEAKDAADALRESLGMKPKVGRVRE